MSGRLGRRLAEVAAEFDRQASAERAQLEATTAAAQKEAHAVRRALDVERLRSTRQAELIEALQHQVRDSQLVETLHSKERLLEQGKMLKELEGLRAEVMALRFQLACVGAGENRGRLGDQPLGENADPNRTAGGGERRAGGKGAYTAQLLRAARLGEQGKVRSLLNPDQDAVAEALAAYRSTLSTALLHAASGPSAEGLAATALTLASPELGEAELSGAELRAELGAGAAADQAMEEGVERDAAGGSESTGTVALLIACGANPFERDPVSRWNAVHHACYAGNDRVLEKLLMAGSGDLSQHLEDATRAEGYTALHLSALRCHPMCVRLLLRAGVDVSALDKDGRTAVDIVLAGAPGGAGGDPAAAAAAEPASSSGATPSSASSPSSSSASSPTSVSAPTTTAGMSAADASLIRAAEAHVREQSRLTLDELNDPATLFWSHSTRANRLYGAEDYDGARRAYAEAIALTERLPEERITSDANRATLYYNSARACAKVARHCEATRACSRAIELRGGRYPNALAQRASSHMALFDYARAVLDYQTLLSDAKAQNAAGGGSPAGSGGSGGADDNWGSFLDRARDLAAKAVDHYLVLGVASDATAAELKKAFRKQCLRWHPDKHRGSEDDTARAGVMFKAINEANEVLGDEQKRTLYDMDRIADKMKELRKNSVWSTGKPGNGTAASAASGGRRSSAASSAAGGGGSSRSDFSSPSGYYRSEFEKMHEQAAAQRKADAKARAARHRDDRHEPHYGSQHSDYPRSDSFRSAHSSTATGTGSSNKNNNNNGGGNGDLGPNPTRGGSGARRSSTGSTSRHMGGGGGQGRGSDSDEDDIGFDNSSDMDDEAFDDWAARRRRSERYGPGASAAESPTTHDVGPGTEDSDLGSEMSDSGDEEEIFSDIRSTARAGSDFPKPASYSAQYFASRAERKY